MDDWGQKISDLLNSEEGLNQIRRMAEMFGFGQGNESGDSAPDFSSLSGMFSGADKESQKKQTTYGQTDFFDMFKNVDMGKVMGMMSAFQKSGNDDNSRLLLSLKPMLTAKRQKRIDEAITMMKLIAILPMLKESGILSGIFGGIGAGE